MFAEIAPSVIPAVVFANVMQAFAVEAIAAATPLNVTDGACRNVPTV